MERLDREEVEEDWEVEEEDREAVEDAKELVEEVKMFTRFFAGSLLATWWIGERGTGLAFVREGSDILSLKQFTTCFNRKFSAHFCASRTLHRVANMELV